MGALTHDAAVEGFVAQVAGLAAGGVDVLWIETMSDLNEVRAAVEHCLAAAKSAGRPAGVNAFAPATARAYLDAGAAFILVGADVALLARGSEALAAQYVQPSDGETPASY